MAKKRKQDLLRKYECSLCKIEMIWTVWRRHWAWWQIARDLIYKPWICHSFWHNCFGIFMPRGSFTACMSNLIKNARKHFHTSGLMTNTLPISLEYRSIHFLNTTGIRFLNTIQWLRCHEMWKYNANEKPRTTDTLSLLHATVPCTGEYLRWWIWWKNYNFSWGHCQTWFYFCILQLLAASESWALPIGA